MPSYKTYLMTWKTVEALSVFLENMVMMINISPFSQVCSHRLVKCCPKQIVHPHLSHLTSILSAMNVLAISSYRVIF